MDNTHSKQKKGLLLASGGIDSPVAGQVMVNLGVDVIAIHFSNEPFTDKRSEEKTVRLMKHIGVKKLYVVPHGLVNQVQFTRNCDRRYQCLFCRRMMFRIASEIAKKENCDFLITGENLGQVASQTLDNMTVNYKASSMKIIRPVLCFDKQEIIKLGREFGTYEISIEKGSCCNLVPDNPVTRGREEDIIREENRLDIDGLVKKSIEKTKEIVIE